MARIGRLDALAVTCSPFSGLRCMSTRALLAVAFAALASCGETGPETLGVPGELAQRRAAWESLRLREYDYDVTYSNEWVTPMRARVSVRNGLVTGVVPLDPAVALPEVAFWPTVDALFDRARQWQENEETVVDVLFHPALSYPTMVRGDAPRWADDAQQYMARNLVRR